MATKRITKKKNRRKKSAYSRVKKKSRKWLWLPLFFFFLIILSGLGGAFYIYYTIGRELPDVNVLGGYVPDASTMIYSHEGELIGEFFVEKRRPLPLDKIPELLRKATIAVEDEHFFEHKGIDIMGIFRAIWVNIKAAKIAQGGSTITQQLAKTLFLTRERTLKRKIREAILAYQIERHFSKKKILELYLNQIYYGQGAYGVEAAAITYFGKHVDELTLAEIAFIAGLPKAPANYSPRRHVNRAVNRRNHVLTRMAENKFISREEEKKAQKTPLKVKKKEKKDNAAAYFLEYIRRKLEQKYESAQIYRSGLSVYTTLNLFYQKAAYRALREGIKIVDKRYGYRGPLTNFKLNSLKDIDWEEVDLLSGEDSKLKRKLLIEDRLPPEEILSGVVLKVEKKNVRVALTPSLQGRLKLKDMSWARKPDPSIDARYYRLKDARKILKKGDLIQVKIIKIDSKNRIYLSLEQDPLVQGALLAFDPQTGFIRAMIGGYDFSRSQFNRAVQAVRQPGSAFKPIIYAAAIENGLTSGTIINDSPLIFERRDGKLWKPVNFTERFYGPTTLRQALIHSRNVVTIKIFKQIGIRKAIEMARRLGITSHLSKDLSLALGSSGVNVMELTTAYGIFAHKGIRTEPMAIKYIKDRNGNTLENNYPLKGEVISEEISYIISNMLEDVVKLGTGRSVKSLKRPVAGKTGTTNNFHDAWFIGYTPDLVTAVWIGIDQEQALGKNETGGRAAAPIWLKFMQEAVSNLPITGFSPPANIIFAKIDPRTGLLALPDTPNAYLECFIEGTEPTTYAPRQEVQSEEFFKLDLEN